MTGSLPEAITITAPLRSPKLLRRIALTAAVLTWLGPFTIDSYSPSLPTIVEMFGTSTSAGQLTLTAALLGLVVGQLIIGLISDKVGRRLPILVSLCGFILSCAACFIAPSIEVLIAARFAQGLFASAGVAMARAIGRDVFEGRELATFYSRLAAATAVAPVVGPILSGLLLDGTGTWRPIFIMIGALGVVSFLLVRFALPETHPRSISGGAVPFMVSAPSPSVLSQRTVVVSAILMACASGVILSYLSGSSFLLQQTFGLTATQFSVIFAINAAGLVTMSNLNSVFIRRWHPAVVASTGIALTFLIGVALIVSFALGASLTVILPLLFGLLSVYGIVNPNVIALGMSVGRNQAGAAAATLGVAQYSFGALTAPLIGVDLPGPIPMMGYAICAYALIGCCVVFAERRRLVAVVEWAPRTYR